MADDEDIALAAVAGALVFPGIMALGMVFGLWRAFAAAKLWLWFVVPTFHVDPIPVSVFFGLAILLGLYRGHREDKRKFWEQAVDWTMSPAVALALGWLFK